MAYTTTPTSATGDLWSAANQNTYLKDNLTALWAYTTAGDLVYAATPSTLQRLAAGTAYNLLYSTGSAPAYGTIATILANAPLVGSQAAGDTFQASSATAITRIAKGSAGQAFIQGATNAAWQALVYRRQGGDASSWQSAGTTTYTPTTAYIQVGVKSVSVNTTGSVTVTYPVAFAQRPVVYVSLNSTVVVGVICQFGSDTLSSFDILCRDVTTSGLMSVDVNWMAVGVI